MSGLPNPFTDIAAGAWYADAVIWAADNGIVSGYGNGLFGAGDEINREQMAVMLANYLRYKGYELSAGQTEAFADEADISAWALESIRAIQAAGVCVGRPGGIFDPKTTATRAEIATVIARFIEIFNGSAQNSGAASKPVAAVFNSAFDVYIDKSAMEAIEKALTGAGGSEAPDNI